MINKWLKEADEEQRKKRIITGLVLFGVVIVVAITAIVILYMN